MEEAGGGMIAQKPVLGAAGAPRALGPVGGQGSRALAPEIVCSNVIVDSLLGRIICADDGTVLSENVIDDDIDASHAALLPIMPGLELIPRGISRVSRSRRKVRSRL